jgi:hypothetical protein
MREMFFQNSTLVCMSKTLNQIFFPPPKSEYFFQQHWKSEFFSRKKNNPPLLPPPFKLNGRSLRDIIFNQSIICRKVLFSMYYM